MTESGVPYQEGFGPRFAKSYRRYKSLHQRIDQIMSKVLDDPYLKSERLGRMPGGLDLRGCRSVRITQSFRLIFSVCEECRRVPECRYCFCEGWSDRTVIFLTGGPHERAYAMREAPVAYVADQAETQEGQMRAQRYTIQAMVYPGDESGYVAECLDLAVVTQGKTLDRTVENLREAIHLHLEGEDLEEMGLAPSPPVLITMEMKPVCA